MTNGGRKRHSKDRCKAGSCGLEAPYYLTIRFAAIRVPQLLIAAAMRQAINGLKAIDHKTTCGWNMEIGHSNKGETRQWEYVPAVANRECVSGTPNDQVLSQRPYSWQARHTTWQSSQRRHDSTQRPVLTAHAAGNQRAKKPSAQKTSPGLA